MNPEIDMITPVTRGELREELTRLELKLEAMMDTRSVESEARLGTYIDMRFKDSENRMDERMGARFEAQQKRMDERMDARFAAQDQRIFQELARHTTAILEAMASQFAAFDDKYRDLPERMARVEALLRR